MCVCSFVVIATCVCVCMIVYLRISAFEYIFLRLCVLFVNAVVVSFACVLVCRIIT